MSSSSSTPTPPPKSFLPLDALFENPVFAGGIGLAGLGAALVFARKQVVKGASTIRQHLLVNVEISRQDASYPWILAWLSLPRPNPGFIESKLTRIKNLSIKTKFRAQDTRPTQTQFLLQPGYGKYFIRHMDAYIQVNREKDSSYNMSTGERFETVTMTALFAHRHIFEDIFREAHALAVSREEGKTVVYTSAMTQWEQEGTPRKKRPLYSVILDKGIKEKVVGDVKEFLSSQQWYVDHGIPYRRGYLLYGPPGSGKTSFIYALAGELDFGVAIINLSARGMTDDRLAKLLTSLPTRTMLVLEDADAAFQNRKQKDADGFSGGTVTFSGLLNALDGIAAGQERITFLTTNHIENLDHALIRPGRVDLRVEIGDATIYQAGELWDRFYGDIDESGQGRKRFLGRLAELGIIVDICGNQTRYYTTMAEMQGLFMSNKNDMEGAIVMAKDMELKRV